METRSEDEDVQYRQFCRRRIDEIDNILSQKIEPVSPFGNKVRFICSSPISLDFPTSKCEENCSSSPSKCFQNEVVYCDILILAASLHVSESPESPSWLLRELKDQMNLSQLTLEEKDMITIFLPEWSLDEARNLKLVIESLTNWAPLEPNGLENLLNSLDRHTGRERWKTLSATEPGYSAPVIRDLAGERVLIVWDSDAVHGMNPETGEVRWSVDFPSTFAMSVATPQVVDRQIFVMCFNGKCALITVAPDGSSAEITWEGGRRIGIDGVHNTPMLVEGYIYGCGNGGRYLCARQSDGEQVWSSFAPASSKRPISWGNVFTVQMTGDGATSRFLLANDHGEVILANLTPLGYEETSRASLIEPTHRVGGRTLVWSHPALANRSIYLRNDREIRCYSLSADQ